VNDLHINDWVPAPMKLALTPPKLSVLRYQPYGLPDRQLELQCQITHAEQQALCLLDSWQRINGPNGLRIAEGRFLTTQHNLVQGALLWPNQSTPATIVVPLAPAILKTIEDRRAGGDFTLVITSNARVCKIVKQPQKQEVLGVPFETYLGSVQHSDRVEYTFSQSDWVKLLRGLNWSELQLVELPLPSAASSLQLSRALKRFEEAQDFYRRGNWEESMSNCRKAFEALVKDTSGKDDMSQSDAAFAALVSDTEKAKRLSELARAFAPFLHLARHEQLPAIPITPKDAMLALQITASILAYLG
jgi:hypothetical protein